MPAGRVVAAAAALAMLLASGPAPETMLGTDAPYAVTSVPVLVAAPAAPVAATAGPVPAAPAAPAAPGTLAALAQLVSPAGKTSLVSAADTGAFPAGNSTLPSVSSSGRYVAFASTATDLLAGGSGGATSVVYLRDRSTASTIALPVPGGGPVPKGASATAPSISADGSVVAFVYASARQVAVNYSSVVVWDRKTGSTTAVSATGVGTADRSREPAVSADGRFIAFTSDDGRLVGNDFNEAPDVFRYDRQTGAIALVSVGLDNTSAAGDSTAPSISGDGSVVAFVSTAGASLVSATVGQGRQVYVRDLNAGSTTLVSVAGGGAAASGESYEPSISDDGRYVAFSSAATNLVDGTASAPVEVYRRDRQAGTTQLISAIDGTPNPSASRQPGISRDGRMVAYAEVGAPSTAALAVRQASEVYLFDTGTNQTVLISVNLAGQPSPSVSAQPKVAGGGRFVAFASGGNDLVAGDASTYADVYLRDLPPAPQLKPAKIDFGTRAVGIAPATAAGVLVNAGWGPLQVSGSSLAGANPGDYAILDDGCAGKSLYGGDACTVTVGFAPTKPGVRGAKLLVADSFTGSPRTATLSGRGSSAKIVLDPPIGPPGIVAIATGSGFPAGTQIALSWSVGITPTMPTVTADAKGGFSVPVLVMRNDPVGQRQLVATWVGGPEFPALQTPMLVTIAPAAPPRFLATGGMPQPLVFRG